MEKEGSKDRIFEGIINSFKSILQNSDEFTIWQQLQILNENIWADFIRLASEGKGFEDNERKNLAKELSGCESAQERKNMLLAVLEKKHLDPNILEVLRDINA